MAMSNVRVAVRRKARTLHGARQQPGTPSAVFRRVSTVQFARENGWKGNIVTSNRAIMDFLQREKCKEKDEFRSDYRQAW